MTYLEAAIAVLREASGPLHYREITERALARQLIEPRGQTPEATMGAQLYLAAKREEAPPVSATGRGHFALSVQRVSPGLDADIQRHNTKVEADLREFLLEMHPRQLELLVGQLLTAIGFEDVAVTRYSSDGGIDVDATLTVGGVTRVRTAIQVKRWKANVSGATVRELRGGLMMDQRGLIITTAGFTKDAIVEAGASAKAPISLIDGKRFVELLAEKQIGVRRKAVYLLELNIGELLVGADEPGSGHKSASLWPLPGGQSHFFETLLAFLDYVASAKPTVEQMTQWVLTHYDKVTKIGVVKSYLRSVLYAMGLTDFDGERVVLTDDGKILVRERDRQRLLALLRANVLGVDEVLTYLADGRSRKVGEVRGHLVKELGLKWESDHQTHFRLQWLEACRAVEKRDDGWRLVG